jgi:alpha-glucuronidase
VKQWRSLKGLIDQGRFDEVLAQLEYQAGQAQVWRDAVSIWFFRESGIADAQGRVGHHPGRLEAEAAELEGYRVVEVTPWEGASGGKAVECAAAQCSATFQYRGAAGRFTLRVQYFDQNNGAARYRVRIGQRPVDEWRAADHLPTQKVDSSSSTRRTISGVVLRPGDRIRIEGTPDSGEVAALDYVEIVPERK